MPLRGLLTPSERFSLSLRFSRDPIEPVVACSLGRIFSGIVVFGSGMFGSRGGTGVCATARLTIRGAAATTTHARNPVLATEAMTSSFNVASLERATGSRTHLDRWPLSMRYEGCPLDGRAWSRVG